MIVRRLEAEDAAEWQRLRLTALEAHPTAFLTTLEEARSRTLESVAAQIATSFVLGAFDDERLVGKMTMVPMKGAAAHRASIFAVYVSPEARGTGVAGQILAAAIEAARANGVLQLELNVEEANARAVAFYRAIGFETCGAVPRAARSANGFHDDLFMVLKLDA